jgi:hypothetical protein
MCKLLQKVGILIITFMRKLTIGIPTYNDYDGLYFSIQAIRMYHPEVLDNIEFVIIDNNPDSEHGKSNRNLTNWIKEPYQYLPFTKYNASTVKNKVFSLSDTPYTLCMDSHVMIVPGALKKLIHLYDCGGDDGNLLQGPLVYDDFHHYSTHFDDTWSSHMWGTWQTDERAKETDAPPFEIPAQGMGLFSCRTDSWLGFNKAFRGFGGEEKYIHEKYRQHGKKTLCLPFLRWLHRFERPAGIPYKNDLKDRFRNYMIGHHELGQDTKVLREQFKGVVSVEDMDKIEVEATVLSKL